MALVRKVDRVGNVPDLKSEANCGEQLHEFESHTFRHFSTAHSFVS